MAETNVKTVSLVLGSGGARGLAHIGIIHWLEESNYNICSIAGSSIGALIGGIYAAGKLNEYEQWVCAIKKIDIVKLLDLSWGASGLVKGDKTINTLVGLVGEQLIEDLPIHYTAVATDVKGQSGEDRMARIVRKVNNSVWIMDIMIWFFSQQELPEMLEFHSS